MGPRWTERFVPPSKVERLILLVSGDGVKFLRKCEVICWAIFGEELKSSKRLLNFLVLEWGKGGHL